MKGARDSDDTCGVSDPPVDREAELAAYRGYLLDAGRLTAGSRGTPLPSSKQQLLVITDYVPTPDADSGSFRLVHLLALWQDICCRVTLACDEPGGDPRYVRDLEQRGLTVITTRAGVEQHLKTDGARYDAVVLCRPDIALRYLFS